MADQTQSPQRHFPLIPDASRSLQAESRDLRNMIYDGQTAIQNLNQQLTVGYTGTITFGVVGGTTNGTITVANGLITAVVPAT